MVDFSNVWASSLYQGLGFQDKVNGSTSLAGFNLGASATTTRSFSISIPYPDSMGLNQIKFTNTGLAEASNKWFLLNGYITIVATEYILTTSMSRAGITQTFTLRFENRTGGTISIPAIDVDTRTYFFAQPYTS